MNESRFVVNASPLIFLAAIDALALLPRLVDQILLPEAVLIPAARPLVERLIEARLYLAHGLVEAALAEVGE